MADRSDLIKQDEVKAKFLKCLKETYGNVTRACARAGTTKDTVYRWRKEDAKFEAEWDDIIQAKYNDIGELAENSLVDGIKDGVPSLIIFALKNVKSDKWKDRTEHDHSHTITTFRGLIEETKRLGINPADYAPESTPNLEILEAEEVRAES